MKKRLSASNLFDRTRSRLTLQYSGVLIVFLALFVALVYTLLYLFIWNDQRARLTGLADSELQTLQKWADSDSNPKRLPPRSVEDAFSISADQSFYYLLAENGAMQLGDETQPELRAQMTALIAAGRFTPNRIDRTVLLTYDNPSTVTQIRPQRGEAAGFLVTGRELMWRGERIGTLYIGKEVAFQDELLRYLLRFLIGMALLFFVLALWLSHYMARKAIVPIAAAYARQREFVADASHELRTPLSVLLASIEALQLEAAGANDSFAQRLLHGMKDEVQAITKLTGDLLHLARSDSGEFELARSVFDAREAAARVIDKLRPLADAKSITMTLEAPNALIVEWDAEKLTQLLILLIDNAIKYTPDKGTVRVTLAAAADKGGRSLMLEVEDSGIGIPAEALPRIFDRFYRQDKARTRQAGGHGLGLAIARSIVEAGGGSIRADSRAGEGATFAVRLPL